MEMPKRLLDLLKSIDYPVDHLPKNLFAYEAQRPELLPIFTWFMNNVTSKSNCVTPKELAVYSSKASQYNHSSEEVSKAIDKFYDKSTKNSKLCPSDIESLKRKILNSEKELIDLKLYETLYKNKIELITDEISLLEQNKNHLDMKFCEIENNLGTVIYTFNGTIDKLDSNIMKLYSSINSIKNDNEYLPKFINLTNIWREKILNMIEINLIKDHSNYTEEIYLLKQISLLLQSVKDLSLTEMNITYDIEKLNTAIHNVSNYLLKYMNHQEIPVEQPKLELESTHSNIFDAVITHLKNKIKLKTTNDNLRFILDTMECYIIMHDTIYVLMKTYYSITNVKCELIFHSKNNLEKILNDIIFDYQYTLNCAETNIIQSPPTKDEDVSIFTNELEKLDVFKNNLRIYTIRCSDEIENLSKTVLQWKNKYHFTRNECTKLITLQSKLQSYSNKLTNLCSNVK